MTDIICGVDVSSDRQYARIGRDGPVMQFNREPSAIADFVAFCRDHQVTLVVMEATGGYEKLLFAQLWAAEIPAAIVTPRAVRRFAEAMGRLEKTDAIDAGMIAWFAATKRIVPQRPASATQQALTAAVLRLRQLTDLRVMETNRQRLETDPAVRASLTALIGAITQQIKAFEARISAMIAADPLWQALDAAFRTIKGVAARTVAGLAAQLPEIGTLNHKAITKLVGYAPIAHDSGKLTGKRPVRGGRPAVRSLLYVVAAVVQRHEPDFTEFHRRLSARGKPKKVIRLALAHKLLIRLNAKAHEVRQKLAQTT